MTKESIRAHLQTEIVGREIWVYPDLPSTNDLAMDLGRKGNPEGGVVFANNQTQGRGRHGRSWSFQRDQSLAFSILLRPAFSETSRLSLAAAVAVARALDGFSDTAVQLKWPNDIYIGGKKIAGILCEAGLGFLVVGIGINVLQEASDFPEDLAERAGSLAMYSKKTPDRNGVAACVLERMDAIYRRLPGAFSEIIAECEERSVLRGRRVEVDRGGETLAGMVAGIDADGLLKLQLSDGKEIALSSGEVTLLTR